MAKHINFKGINKDAMQALSAFVDAEYALRSLKEKYKEESDKIESAISDILEKRNEYLANYPQNGDLARSKFSTVELDAKAKALREKYLDECKPHKTAQGKALKLVSADLYYGYVGFMTSGSDTAKVSCTIQRKNKGALVEEKINLDKSYRDLTTDFLRNLGLDYSESANKAQYDRAISKFGAVMVARTSGVVRNNKDFEFIKNKSERQYNTIWVLSFVDYLVNTLEMYAIVQNKVGKYQLVLR